MEKRTASMNSIVRDKRYVYVEYQPGFRLCIPQLEGGCMVDLRVNCDSCNTD